MKKKNVNQKIRNCISLKYNIELHSVVNISCRIQITTGVKGQVLKQIVNPIDRFKLNAY